MRAILVAFMIISSFVFSNAAMAEEWATSHSSKGESGAFVNYQIQ